MIYFNLNNGIKKILNDILGNDNGLRLNANYNSWKNNNPNEICTELMNVFLDMNVNNRFRMLAATLIKNLITITGYNENINFYSQLCCETTEL